MVDMELHPYFKKKILNLFECIKLFFLQFPFLVDIIEIKPATGNHESNFKKVGAIPCGCNTKWTKRNTCQ